MRPCISSLRDHAAHVQICSRQICRTQGPNQDLSLRQIQKNRITAVRDSIKYFPVFATACAFGVANRSRRLVEPRGFSSRLSSV